MFLVMTCACIVLSAVVHRAHVERDADLAVASAGGTVVYDFQVDIEELPRRHFFHALPYRRRRPAGSQWLRSILGDEYFRRIVAVYLGGNSVTRGDLAKVARLPRLKCLHLYGAVLPDDGAAALAEAAGLEELHMGDTNVSDDSIEQLLMLHRLRILKLGRTRVTDAGAKRMRGSLVDGWCDLEYLDLSECDVTDDGIRSLIANLPPLKALLLNGTNVTESGVKCVRESWRDCAVYGP